MIFQCGGIADLTVFPFPWETVSVLSLGKTFIEQKYDSPVRFCADHASGGLKYFVDSRIKVCIVEPPHSSCIKISFQDFPVITYLWKSCSNNNRADQSVCCQIDSLREYPAITQKPTRLLSCYGQIPRETFLFPAPPYSVTAG